jgi:hypothetical protein
MYALLLALHSWLRWLALVGGVAATGAAMVMPTDHAPATKSAADRWSLIFMIALDLQFLIGVLLYFVVSPTMSAIRADFGAAMRDPVARFWAVEHITMMLAAVVLVHVGRVLARKAPTAAKKRTRLLVFNAIATIVMLAAIPWPGMRAGRALFYGL